MVRIINEPTAAALAYGSRGDVGEKVLVYDLGGGTFDVSLLLIENGVFEVLSTGGDSLLGGDDFDNLLRDHLIGLLPPETVKRDDKRTYARLKNTAGTAKIALSTKTLFDVREEFIGSHKGIPQHIEHSLARNDFELLIEQKLNKTFELVDQVLSDGKTKSKAIDKIIMVGGSSYIPRIFDVLASERGFNVHREIDQTYAVALGAAIQGEIISGEAIESILIDVNSHSLGIQTLNVKPTGEEEDDCYNIVIHKNTSLPASMTKTYYTCVENQKRIQVSAYQGEHPVASEK